MTNAQLLVRSDMNDRQRMEWLAKHGEPLGVREGEQNWRLPDGSIATRVAVLGCACYGSQPAPEPIPTETVSDPEIIHGQNGRDAHLVKIERRDASSTARTYRLTCRQHGETKHEPTYPNYYRAYDDGEAWAWRGEIPEAN